MTKFKPTLAIDFDGVIHLYSKGWRDGSIYDDVTPGFFDWAQEAQKYFKLVIHTSRAKDEAGRTTVLVWLAEKLNAWAKQKEEAAAAAGSAPWCLDAPGAYMQFELALEKPPAFLTIDDRGLTFSGNWNDFPPEKLLAFKPWNHPSTIRDN